MRAIARLAPLLAAAFALFGNVEQAHARRGIPLFIQTGAAAAEIGEPPAGFAGGSDVKVGYVYQHVAVFWITIWTWGGEYAMFRRMGDIEYQPLTKEQVAEILGKSPDEIGPPLAYRWPMFMRFLVGGGLIFAGFVGFGAVVTVGEKRRFAALKADPLYRKAMKILAEKVDSKPGTAYLSAGRVKSCIPAAGKFLVSKGIEKAEAKKNLTFIAGQMYPHQRDEGGPPDE